MHAPLALDESAWFALARRHGLALRAPLTLDNLGLDFQVATAHAEDGRAWILRVPRHPHATAKIDYEARVLAFLRAHWRYRAPDWHVASHELIAYPKLEDLPALQVDGDSHALTWHIDPSAPDFTRSLGQALASLHTLPLAAARDAGWLVFDAATERAALLERLDRVQRALDLPAERSAALRRWLDDDAAWPDTLVPVHGDLYAGHTLVDARGQVTAFIDWTEAKLACPSTDFAGHLAGFGEAGLDQLIASYTEHGGPYGPQLRAQALQRQQLQGWQLATYALDTDNPKWLESARQQLLG